MNDVKYYCYVQQKENVTTSNTQVEQIQLQSWDLLTKILKCAFNPDNYTVTKSFPLQFYKPQTENWRSCTACQ